MALTTLQVAEKLRAQGHKVETRKRSDGGYFITEIDGVKYKKADGNKVARAITGEALSSRRTSQLNYATKQQKALKKPKASDIFAQDDELRKQFNRTQRAWRKSKKSGKITKKKVKHNLEHLAYDPTLGTAREQVMDQLRRMERYAKGFAYEINVMWLIGRLKDLRRGRKEQQDKDNINEIIRNIEEKIDQFRDEWISTINDHTYNVEKGQETTTDLLDLIKALTGVK